MKKFHLLIFTLLCFCTACFTTSPGSESSSVAAPSFNRQSMEPRTVAQTIKNNPDSAERYQWLSESERQSVYVIVDDFPSLINGLRALHQDISRAISRDESHSCNNLNDEPIRYQIIINENGRVSKVDSYSEVPTACEQVIWSAISSQRWEPGKVDGKPVKVLYNVPVRL